MPDNSTSISLAASKSGDYYRELSAFLQSIFDGTTYNIISTDIDGTIRTINKAAQNMLGYTQEELVGKHTPAILHDAEEVKQRAIELSSELGQLIEPGFEVFVAKSRHGEPEELEWTYISKDGSRTPVLLSVTPLYDNEGNLNGFLGISFDITEKVQIQEALHEEEARYRQLFEHAGDSIFLMMEDLFIDCNPATLRMFGCTSEQILNTTPYRFSPEYQPDGQLSKTKALQKINAALLGRTQSFEWQHLRYDGTPFDAEVTLNAVIIKGETHLLATVRDITNRKSAERALEISRLQLIDRNESLWLVNKLSAQLHGIHSTQKIINETLNTLLSLTHTPHVAIYLYDKKDNLLHLSASHGFDETTRKIGQTIPINGSLSGLALQQGHLLTSEDFSTDNRLHHDLKKALLTNKMNSAAVIPLIYQNRPLGSINLIYNGKRSFNDIDKETLETIGSTVSLSITNAQHLNDLEFMAHHDSLTKLSNRLHFHEVFKEMIDSQPDISSILLLIDLDRFKEINDTLGHHIGDKLLEQIGPRLKSINTSYKTHISRLGGDEFTLLVYGMSDLDAINEFSQKVLDSLREPFSIDLISLEIDASIGIARYPMDGKDSHALLRSADVAMYEAKRKGVHFEIYDRGSDKHSPERLALSAELGSAIRNNQLILHYQPKIESKSGIIKGFEALVRWQHPEKGLLYPDKFLSLAEVSETIHYLTQTVLTQALEQQKQWKQSGYNYSVSVNLSARNLIDDRCVNVLENLLEIYDTKPGDLELEITETALMQDPDRAIHLLNRISKLGIKLSIDDYGTGYSSLSYLRQLPIDALKIDRLFVKDMLSNEHDAIIVSSTITLAHNLSLEVIAEGVEDNTTMTLLKTMGCDLVQGYFIRRPMSWSDIEQWLKTEVNVTSQLSD